MAFLANLDPRVRKKMKALTVLSPPLRKTFDSFTNLIAMWEELKDIFERETIWGVASEMLSLKLSRVELARTPP